LRPPSNPRSRVMGKLDQNALALAIGAADAAYEVLPDGPGGTTPSVFHSDVIGAAIEAYLRAIPPVAEPVAWLHVIQEPDTSHPQTMYSGSPDNPWSHWLESHRDQCVYSCTPLYTALEPIPSSPVRVSEGMDWKGQCALESRRRAMLAEALHEISAYPPQGTNMAGQAYGEAWALGEVQKLASAAIAALSPSLPVSETTEGERAKIIEECARAYVRGHDGEREWVVNLYAAEAIRALSVGE
jgi:hypothetical protein